MPPRPRQLLVGVFLLGLRSAVQCLVRLALLSASRPLDPLKAPRSRHSTHRHSTHRQSFSLAIIHNHPFIACHNPFNHLIYTLFPLLCCLDSTRGAWLSLHISARASIHPLSPTVSAFLAHKTFFHSSQNSAFTKLDLSSSFVARFHHPLITDRLQSLASLPHTPSQDNNNNNTATTTTTTKGLLVAVSFSQARTDNSRHRFVALHLFASESFSRRRMMDVPSCLA